MMKLSVLLAAIFLKVAVSRRLTEAEIETNEIDPDPAVNMGFAQPTEWVKIGQPPFRFITVALGSRVELECEAMGSPIPVMQWLKGNQPLTENESYDTNAINDSPTKGMAKVRTRLVINHALPIHQGTFICLAESGSQYTTAKTKLVIARKNDKNFTTLLATEFLGVHHIPRITLWIDSLMDVLGNDVVLPCQSVGNPKPQLTWYDPIGGKIETNEKTQILRDGALRIRSLVWNDMGLYTCVSKNSEGEDRVQTFLYPMKASN